MLEVGWKGILVLWGQEAQQLLPVENVPRVSFLIHHRQAPSHVLKALPGFCSLLAKSINTDKLTMENTVKKKAGYQGFYWGPWSVWSFLQGKRWGSSFIQHHVLKMCFGLCQKPGDYKSMGLYLGPQLYSFDCLYLEIFHLPSSGVFFISSLF